MIIDKLLVILLMIVCILMVIYMSPNIVKFVENNI